MPTCGAGAGGAARSQARPRGPGHRGTTRAGPAGGRRASRGRATGPRHRGPVRRRGRILVPASRPLAPAQHHEPISAAYHALSPGDGFVLPNDHDPRPLRYQFDPQHPESHLGLPGDRPEGMAGAHRPGPGPGGVTRAPQGKNSAGWARRRVTPGLGRRSMRGRGARPRPGSAGRPRSRRSRGSSARSRGWPTAGPAR